MPGKELDIDFERKIIKVISKWITSALQPLTSCVYFLQLQLRRWWFNNE